eukprot:763695-Rhodomonas_salina.3
MSGDPPGDSGELPGGELKGQSATSAALSAHVSYENAMLNTTKTTSQRTLQSQRTGSHSAKTLQAPLCAEHWALRLRKDRGWRRRMDLLLTSHGIEVGHDGLTKHLAATQAPSVQDCV